MNNVKVIAEIGSSPAPDWDFALWCDAARDSGAHAVKAQMWRADHFPAGEVAGKLPYEFPRERLADFVRAAHARHILAGISVFDVEGARLAAQHCDWLKLAAREQANVPLLTAVIRTGKRLYRSIDAPRHYLAGISTFATVQTYPLSMARALLAVACWAVAFRWLGAQAWGWSSHTRGALDARLAVALGATTIEKHLALHPQNVEARHSLQPAQFGNMVKAVSG